YKSNAVASRSQPSPRATIDPHASPTSCPASLQMPKTPPTVSTQTPTLPFPVWVNDPLGANLRTSANASSARITTLNQGTQANADAQQRNAGGDLWYHVSVGTTRGWVRSDLVATTALHAANGPGWSLMLPQGYASTPSSDPSLTNVLTTGDDLPFLIVQTTNASTLTVQLPGILRADLAPISDHVATIQVWNYTVNEQVSRVALDTCKVMSAWARADQGWPYETSVYIHTSGRNYEFTFFTPDANSALAAQVLNSVALS
ncbi:MAG TPA: SH3 domain-containing protein, partial [Candidatus Dormibacteraeota bacterium]